MTSHQPSHSSVESLQHELHTTYDLQHDPILFISHEMRTPLTSIQGVLGLLYMGQFGSLSEEGRKLLEIALNNTRRLTRLANAIEGESISLVTPLSPSEIEQIQLENDLQQALTHQQLRLDYQPIVEVGSAKIVSLEALLRWHHPVKGNIPPTVFIPIAERIGFIYQLGIWVLKQACHQLVQWQREFPHLEHLSISVNLSAIQLLQPDLLQQVQLILQEAAIAPHCLKLEVTETALVDNQELASSILFQLRSMGVQVYVDDFGTGYSSLSRLQDLPIDALKIDRSFIRFKRWDISEAIITLAAKLGLSVIAEGVETPEELATLKNLGCKQMQGYFFSKPVDLVTATELLASQSSSSTPCA